MRSTGLGIGAAEVSDGFGLTSRRFGGRAAYRGKSDRLAPHHGGRWDDATAWQDQHADGLSPSPFLIPSRQRKPCRRRPPGSSRRPARAGEG